MPDAVHAVIDLRSDTVTQPTPAMREAMRAAALGDDVLEGDPTVRRLEQRVAELLGKQAALFVPSGTMANLLALLSQTHPGDEVVCDRECHIYYYEAGGYAAVAGVSLKFTSGERGLMTPADLRRVLRPRDDHFPTTRLVAVENTHNRAGGIPWPVNQLAETAAFARERGLRVHMDGARLWNACAATGATPGEIARHVDSVSVCFSKGLGCPVGSALVSDAATIAVARHKRKMLGGAMRQSGGLAGAALFALDHHRERLVDDARRARRLAELIAAAPKLKVDFARVQTNMVYFSVDASLGTAGDFCARLDVGAGAPVAVRMLDEGPQSVRAVVHLHIDDAAIELAGRAIADAGR